ncbi:Ecs exoprotein ABC transporter permease [Fictibacillus macauensis ZFHKF-1]|uniref:Ecs exoprotein ABC transporter permease n=1 Tax=Fictibacillus macauensis ZFHKF-1 TaxID=1196324 RepID=I8J275_9BACL|nr:ABC transporter permease [Fictibacillus macauensis]EIT85846.1 Ecs exoprotein ABC transporter permease [Fictibacillus macauensis ZFHKF-1]
MIEVVEQLWKKRRDHYLTIALKYFRLIGNSGFMLSLYILFVTGSFYYAQILKQLPDQFPAVWVLLVVFLYLLTRSPFRTFLQSGDLVFLLPIEPYMKAYFKKSFYYTFLIQAFSITLVTLALGPLYSRFISLRTSDLIITLLLLIVVKGWNIRTSWEEQRLPYEVTRRSYRGIRICVNGVFLYLLFEKAYVFVIAMFAVMYVLHQFVYKRIQREYSIKWEHLIHLENRAMMKLYRIANLFTDVPQLSQKVRPRKWLSFLAHAKFAPRRPFHGLYRKTFIRSNDYLGIYVRLTLIGLLFLWWIPSGWWHVALLLLFTHATGVQLLPLFKHHKGNVWFELYPLQKDSRFQAFKGLLQTLLSVQLCIFLLFLIILQEKWSFILLCIVGAVLFILYFVNFYTKSKLRDVK